jgi:hypothetical protein
MTSGADRISQISARAGVSGETRSAFSMRLVALRSIAEGWIRGDRFQPFVWRFAAAWPRSVRCNSGLA